MTEKRFKEIFAIWKLELAEKYPYLISVTGSIFLKPWNEAGFQLCRKTGAFHYNPKLLKLFGKEEILSTIQHEWNHFNHYLRNLPSV